jgi:small GTP-binding protein
MGNQTPKILLLGLENTGKTTLLYKLLFDKIIDTIPSIHANVETVEYKNHPLQIYDIRGCDKMRSVYPNYYSGTHAVIFMMDSRIEESFMLFWSIMNDTTLGDIPVLILINKMDRPGCPESTEVLEQFKLTELKKTHMVQRCSVITGEGLFEGLDWLLSKLEKK